MVDLQARPFELDTEQINWVKKTFKTMTNDEKIGQLFVPIGYSTDHEYLDQLLTHHIGGLFFRSGHTKELRATFEYAQAQTKIPLLAPANLEYGGTGAVIEGSDYAQQMAVAATGQKKYAYKLGMIAAKDAKAVGINWGFSPVVDLDLNFHSPIMNVRTYGDDPDRVIAFAEQYIKAFHDNGLMTSIKHFPGDGVDERDQHLVTSINSLSLVAWKETYGKIYQKLIDFGTKAVMVGHIAFPAYSGDQVPASLNPKLLQGLLRKDLKFNGLVITDASVMVGFTSVMKRSEAVPAAIQNGCDMFLFNHDFVEDYGYMKAGLADGRLTQARLDEAVLRILATKAALNLNQGVKIPNDPLKDYHTEQVEVADRAVTLVQDKQQLLPISSKKEPRILLEMMGNFDSNERVQNRVVQDLTNKGFKVTVYEPETNFFDLDSVEHFKSQCDLVLYVANVENASNQTTARLNWRTLYGLGNNLPWFVKEIPTMMISFGNPYHLFDAPMIETLVNAYCNYDYFIDAAIDKIVGLSEFKGISPIDPFCRNLKLKELHHHEDQ